MILIILIIIDVTLVNCILSGLLLFFFHPEVVFNVYTFTESSAEELKEPPLWVPSVVQSSSADLCLQENLNLQHPNIT